MAARQYKKTSRLNSPPIRKSSPATYCMRPRSQQHPSIPMIQPKRMMATAIPINPAVILRRSEINTCKPFRDDEDTRNIHYCGALLLLFPQLPPAVLLHFPTWQNPPRLRFVHLIVCANLCQASPGRTERQTAR